MTSCEDSLPLLSFLGGSSILLVASVGTSFLTEPLLLKLFRALPEAHPSVIYPMASVNTFRLKLPSAAFYFGCLFWTPDLYIQLPMWHFHLETSQASQMQCSYRTYVYTCTCTHTHTSILSPLFPISVNGTTVYAAHQARNLGVLLDSHLPLIPTANIHHPTVLCISWFCPPLSPYTAKPPAALIWTIALISWPASNFHPSPPILSPFSSQSDLWKCNSDPVLFWFKPFSGFLLRINFQIYDKHVLFL